MFANDRATKGERTMDIYEKELIRMIREHDEPEKAMMIAVEVITSYLRQYGSSGGQAPCDPAESAGTT